MEEQYIYTRKDYEKQMINIARHMTSSPKISTLAELMYVVFSINTSVTKLHVFPYKEYVELLVFSPQPFDDYALNFFRQYKPVNLQYTIIVKKDWLFGLRKTIQKVII